MIDAVDVSLTSVPLNHPRLSISKLEAEAHAYLDRLLDVFYSDDMLVHLLSFSRTAILTETLETSQFLVLPYMLWELFSRPGLLQ